MLTPSKFLRRLIIGSALTAASLVTTAMVALAEPSSAPPSSDGGTTAPAARAGQWIHVDPQTGKRTTRPAVSAAIAANPAFSTSHQGLIEEPAPGGGMMLNLQGRFRSAATATVGADGKVAVECVAPGTAAAAVKP